jgi:hypothetical protein
MGLHEEATRQIKSYLLRTNVLYFSIAINIVVFAVVTLFLTGFGVQGMQAPEGRETAAGWLIYLAPASGLAMALLGMRFFRTRNEQAQKAETLFLKMEGYRSATLLRMVLWDAAALANLVAFMFNVQWLHMVLATMVLVLYAMHKPSLNRMIRDLNLSGLEEQVLRDHAAKKGGGNG